MLVLVRLLGAPPTGGTHSSQTERGADVEGWDLTLVIDCTKEQHERLQKLIGQQLAEDRLPNRPA